MARIADAFHRVRASNTPGLVAYVTAGEVYFSVRSSPGYGELSGQDPEATHAGEDDPAGGGKQDARDFALWKRPGPAEPITA